MGGGELLFNDEYLKLADSTKTHMVTGSAGKTDPHNIRGKTDNSNKINKWSNESDERVFFR